MEKFQIEISNMRVWERKRIDILILMLYVLLFSAGMHINSTLKNRKHSHMELTDRLLDPFSFCLCLFISILIMSPFTFYYKKVPRKLVINPEERHLQILKKRNSKPLNFDLDRITYYSESHFFFTTLEIYSEFTSSRGVVMNKRFTGIVVPSFGFSWNKKIIRQITNTFKEQNVQIEKNPDKIGIWEQIYN
jgi:hypothetical protein